jgi:hypothetical protein
MRVFERRTSMVLHMSGLERATVYGDVEYTVAGIGQ